LLGFLAVAFICNPYSFLRFKDFYATVTHLPYIPVSPLFHLKVSLAQGCGVFMLACGASGMGLALYKKDIRHVSLLAYVVVFYLVLIKATQAAERLVLPMVPVIVVFSAAFVLRIKDYCMRIRRPIAPAVFFVLAAFLTAPSLIRIYYSDKLFLAQDTRTRAYAWIKGHIAKNERIALDATTSGFPRLEKSREQLKALSSYQDKAPFRKPAGSAETKLKFMLNNPSYPEQTYTLYYLVENTDVGFLAMHPSLAIKADEITKNRINYAVLSHILQRDSYSSFLKEFEAGAELLMAFSPYEPGITDSKTRELTAVPAAGFMLEELRRRQSYGPLIKIYKVL
jgi:hypothetical protein